MKVEGKLKATQEAPQFVSIDLDTKKADVGDVAKAVAHTDTPREDLSAWAVTTELSDDTTVRYLMAVVSAGMIVR